MIFFFFFDITKYDLRCGNSATWAAPSPIPYNSLTPVLITSLERIIHKNLNFSSKGRYETLLRSSSKVQFNYATTSPPLSTLGRKIERQWNLKREGNHQI